MIGYPARVASLGIIEVMRRAGLFKKNGLDVDLVCTAEIPSAPGRRQATQEFKEHGWCHTGDIGFLDAEGYLHISGRKKNRIKSGGISVFPEEIEETLRKHPAVADAAVIGFQSRAWGEAVKALGVLHPGSQCSAENLIQLCKESLAPYKAPKTVEFCSAAPRTGLGKIDRVKIGVSHSAGIESRSGAKEHSPEKHCGNLARFNREVAGSATADHLSHLRDRRRFEEYAHWQVTGQRVTTLEMIRVTTR